jgi:hypothetical protein
MRGSIEIKGHDCATLLVNHGLAIGTREHASGRENAKCDEDPDQDASAQQQCQARSRDRVDVIDSHASPPLRSATTLARRLAPVQE